MRLVVLVLYLAGYVYTARRTAWRIMAAKEAGSRYLMGPGYVTGPCIPSERLWACACAVGIALVWPTALLAMAMFWRMLATPVQQQARIEQQRERIAELEKELAIGQEPAPQQQPERRRGFVESFADPKLWSWGRR